MSARTPEPSDGETALAIICGGGSLPFALADAAIAARPARRAVRAARLGRSATRRGLSASLDLDRPVRPLPADRRRGRLPRRRLHRLGGAAFALADPARLRRAAADAAARADCSAAATIICSRASAGCSSSTAFVCSARRRSRPNLPMPHGPLGAAFAERAGPRRHRARPCAAQCHQPVRHRPGRGRRRQSGAGGGRARKAPTRCSRGWRSCAATGRIRHADGHRRAGQGAEARPGPSHRSAGRSGRRPSRPPHAAGLAGIAVVAGSTHRGRARAHRRRGRSRQDLRHRRRRRWDGPMTAAAPRPPAKRPANWRFSWSPPRNPATGSARR